jgi:hypothetical protein
MIRALDMASAPYSGSDIMERSTARASLACSKDAVAINGSDSSTSQYLIGQGERLDTHDPALRCATGIRAAMGGLDQE